MTNPDAKPAVLLFFLRWPEPGRVKTRLAATVGADVACSIHRHLATVCFHEARSVPGVELVVCGTGAPADRFREWLPGASHYWDQPEGDLGVRLEALFARAFELGASQVAAIGSDAASLGSEDIASALRQLDHCEVSLLPARDGGYVLIGLSSYSPVIFREMPWSQSDLLRSTIVSATKHGMRVAVGPVFEDVDNQSDWEALLLTRPDLRLDIDSTEKDRSPCRDSA